MAKVLCRNVPMSSFGEGYATRSDEEGFGGTYGGNAEEMPEQDKIVHGKVPGNIIIIINNNLFLILS